MNHLAHMGATALRQRRRELVDANTTETAHLLSEATRNANCDAIVCIERELQSRNEPFTEGN